MESVHHPDARAVVLTPEAEDAVEDLEDEIHDAIVRTRDHEEGPARVVALDLSGLSDEAFPVWMKALGPAVPDADLRVVVSPTRLAVATRLGLTAFFEWYASVEEALAGGV